MLTIKQLADLSGVTPRALRHYDAIGLLKPEQVGENGYRYYGEASLLRLQQILLYRQMGMPLARIRDIMGKPGFDTLLALDQHKHELGRRVTRLRDMIATIDQTVRHLKGEITMSGRQFFKAFTDEEQAEYEEEAMRMYDPEIVKASARRWKSYSPEEKQRIQEEGSAVYRDMIASIPKGPASPEAQDCVTRWRAHMAYYWTPDDDQCLALAGGYNDDPRFKANFDQMHPELAAFIREAVRVHVTSSRGSI
jgi:MerR family transcriptional regulator, thiopeptide resistance regulator